MTMASIRYISFDCYGTLIDFRINDVTRTTMADRLAPASVDAFLRDFSAYRFDETLGAWKPYADVLHDALERSCRRWGIPFDARHAEELYRAVPTWGPHADVPTPLARVAEVLPLVILSNAAEEQIDENVQKLGAPFQTVLTAEAAGAYKPRLQAFEYMLDHLGCGPEHVMHVSSSLRYDLMSAHDLGFGRRVFVDRGHGPGNPAYGYQAIADLSGLPSLLGL